MAESGRGDSTSMLTAALDLGGAEGLRSNDQRAATAVPGDGRSAGEAGGDGLAGQFLESLAARGGQRTHAAREERQHLAVLLHEQVALAW